MKNDIQVAKMHNRYIGGDCAQIMIPYLTTMSIFDNNEILFHANAVDGIEVNKYLYDERRKKFPYYDIPTHYEKKLFREKTFYVNQIFDFEKPYLLIRSGLAQQVYVSNLNEETYIFHENIRKINSNRQFLNSEGLHAYFKDLMVCDKDEQSYAISMDGRFLNFISKEERMVQLHLFLDYLEENGIDYNYNGHDLTYDYVPDKNKIPSCMIPIGTPIFIVKISDGGMKVKLAEATNMDRDYVRLMTYDLPINKYTLEQILSLTNQKNIKTLNEPTFKRRFNKNISKSLILSNKKIH